MFEEQKESLQVQGTMREQDSRTWQDEGVRQGPDYVHPPISQGKSLGSFSVAPGSRKVSN